MSKLTKGLAVVGIPVYIIGGFFIGQYLGEQFGNPAVGIVIGLFAGLFLALYDVYLIVLPVQNGKDHG